MPRSTAPATAEIEGVRHSIVIHAGVLPEPLPDEHWLSLLGRYGCRLGYGKLSQFHWGRMSEADRRFAMIDYMPRLRRIFSGISSESCAALAEEMLLVHSAVGLHDLFAPSTAVRRLLAAMLTGHWQQLGRRGAYLYQWWPEYRYYMTIACCRDCVEEERARNQRPYWHTSHNLDGVVVCSVHGRVLELLRGRSVYLALEPAGNVNMWGLRQIVDSRSVEPVHVVYARAAREVFSLCGCGYIGEELVHEYAVLVDEMVRGLVLPRRYRSERARRALDILAQGTPSNVGDWCTRKAFRVLSRIFRDVAEVDKEFAVRMLGRERFEPVEQLSMHALDLIDVLGAAQRTSIARRAGVEVSGCGFPRCRWYQPDWDERCARLRGLRLLPLKCECTCGFSVRAPVGQRRMEVGDYGRTATQMLEELLRDGIRDDATLGRALGVSRDAVCTIRRSVESNRASQASAKCSSTRARGVMI